MKNWIGLVLILLFGFNYSNAQPGQPDPSFGNDGKVIIQTLNDNSPRLQEGMAIQPDGKIVLAGSTQNRTFDRLWDFIVFRLLPDGKLDSSFGENGSVVIDYVPNQEERDPRFDEFAKDVAIGPDGKIVVTGGTRRFHNGVWEYETLVVRLNANGSRDLSFDGDGIKAINLVSGYEIAEAVSILPDNKILLAGRLAKLYNADPFGAPLDMMIIKLKTDGQFDETFGINGTSIIDLGHSEKANAMIVQQDGRIIVGGDIYYEATSQHDFALVRLLANGSPDPLFSGDGILLFDMGAQFEWLNSMAIQQDEKIVITGYYQESMSADIDIPVARINADGTFDFSFDFGGTKVIRTAGASDEGRGVAIDQYNNILIGASAQQVQYGDYEFAVFRLTPDGTLDTRFDEDGKVFVDFGEYDSFSSMQLQADGKVVLGGTSPYPGPEQSFSVARLLNESNPSPLIAKPTYIGPEILGTPCYGCQTAIIPLRATVTAPNTPSSDIRNVRVKFVDRDNNTDITGWIPAAGFLEAGDFNVGTVAATWYVTLSYAQPVKKVRVGMVVDYSDSVRDDPSDDAMITLYMPQDDVISGGGELFVSSTSKGKYKANEGSVTMFGFYAQLKPGMPQPSGYMNMWFSGRNATGSTVTYKLEINTMNGLGVNNSSLTPKNAAFHGRGKLWQGTGSGTQMLAEDNVMVQTKMVDGGDIYRNKDSLTVYIWSSNNVLIHTSTWLLYEAVPQSLFHGQVTVHSGSSLDERTSELITQSQAARLNERKVKNTFEVSILNNPTRNAFSLNVSSNTSNVYSIRVSDLSGRVIEFRNNIPVAQTLQFGSDYRKGMYFAEIREGRNVRTIKLVKH